MSDLTCFSVHYDDGVAELRLNRPAEKNSLIPPFWGELRTLVEEIDRESRARVIIVTSTGKHFSVGLDTKAFGSGMFGGPADHTEQGRKRARFYQGVKSLQETFTAIERARVPVIAAVQGACAGAALAMVAACDLRYATRDAFFLIAETNIGIVAEVGTLQRLPKVMPAGVVREMALRGMRLPADRAESLGLVNGLYQDHEALLAGARQVAREIAAKSPLTMWGIKHTLNHARDHAVEDGLDHVALWQAGMYFAGDTLATLQAKQEGTDPGFEELSPAP